MLVNLFILHRLPQSLDEDVVTLAAPAIHANRDAVSGEQTGERVAGELATLVGVEDPWTGLDAGTEHLRRHSPALCQPLRDLVGMYIKMLGQFG
jgi:hypothetical protein